MKIIETEAEKFWCPAAKPGVVRKDSTGKTVEHSNCIGACCALWIIYHDDQKFGYCGLPGPRGPYQM